MAEKLTLRQKSGFYSNDPVIIIRNVNGQVFYLKENKKGLLHFNLPAGQYFTDNVLQITEVRKYKKFKLPKPNATYEIPEGFTVYFSENPNLCTVDHNNHTINFDESFRGMHPFILDYVLFHEIGHYAYTGKGQKSEKAADKFSYNQMIEKGYNPSQIQLAIETSLSNRKAAKRRKKNFLLMNQKQK